MTANPKRYWTKTTLDPTLVALSKTENWIEPAVEIQLFEPRPRPLVCFSAIVTVPLGSMSDSLVFLKSRELEKK
jgi:hypothetical protein